MPKDTKKRSVSYRLSNEAMERLAHLKNEWGLDSDTQVVETSLARCTNGGEEDVEPTIACEIRFTEAAIRNYFVKYSKTLESPTSIPLPITKLSHEDRGYVWDQLNGSTQKLVLTKARVTMEKPRSMKRAEYEKATPEFDFFADLYPENPEEWGILLDRHREFAEACNNEFTDTLRAESQQAIQYFEKLIADGKFKLHPFLMDDKRLIPFSPRTLEHLALFDNAVKAAWDNYDTKYTEHRKQLEEKHKREKTKWIELHASERLRKAFKLGYECERLYLDERQAVDFPGFNLLKDWHSTSEVDTPTLEAVDLAGQLGGRIVNLHENVCDEDTGRDFSTWTGEAVVIDWIANHQLYRVVQNEVRSELPIPF